MLSLCLYLSSLSLYLLITAVIVINYGLECVTNSVLAYIHLSTHILFVYKLVFGGLNVYRCFTHYLNFQGLTIVARVTR